MWELSVGLVFAAECSCILAVHVGPAAGLPPWLGAATWERAHFRSPVRGGLPDTSELVRYIQAPGPQVGSSGGNRGAPFVDLRLAHGGPPAAMLPSSLEECSAEQLLWIFASANAFAGLSCVLEEEGPGLVGCGAEVSCWHAPLRLWPPEDVSASWRAALLGRLPTEDCGRVCYSLGGGKARLPPSTTFVEEWYEYDLSGEGYEELWRRMPDAPITLQHTVALEQMGSLSASLAAARISAEPFELLVVAAGRFGYFRDSRSPALAVELRALDAAGLGLDKLILDDSRSLAWRRAALNCEASVGIVSDWRIEHSALPWLIGTRLRLARGDGWVDLAAGGVAATPSPELIHAFELLLQEASVKPAKDEL